MGAPGTPSYGARDETGKQGAATGDPLPRGLRWVPGFLTAGAADRALASIVQSTPWEAHQFTIFGRTVPMPRRIAWYGAHTYGYSGVVHPARPMTPTLAAIRDRVARACGHPFNCVLLNLYRDGQDSMGWHRDDDYDAGPHTGVASLSLGATRRMRLRTAPVATPGAAPARRRAGLDLMHGSLLFMAPGFQAAWQHAVPRTARAVGPRLNLTFRHLVAANVRP